MKDIVQYLYDICLAPPLNPHLLKQLGNKTSLPSQD